MGYAIEAFLDQGTPSLKIIDIDKQKTCLSWRFSNIDNETNSKSEIQRLFRELILLSCKQEMHNVRLFSVSN